MVDLKPVSFATACRSFLDSCNMPNKANSHIPKVEIHTRQKLHHFGRYVAKAKLFCQKSFVPVNRVGVLIWVNFHPGYRDLGRKNRDLGNRARPASHMNTSKFFTKERVARRDHGNRASPFDRAHMKRLLNVLSYGQVISQKFTCPNYISACPGQSGIGFGAPWPAVFLKAKNNVIHLTGQSY